MPDNPTARGRPTRFRQEIMRLLNDDRAWTASQIRNRLKGADLSTVYRNLQRLLDESALIEAGINADEKYFEMADRGHHAHLICEKCRGAFCIPCPVPTLKRRHELSVFGVCRQCR